MIDLFTIDDSKLNKGTQLLREEVKKRGWKAELAYIGSPHCYIDRGDGKKIHIFGTTPPTSSFASAHLANDKFATYQLLKEVDVPQPETVSVDADNMVEALALLQKHGKLVVKPCDAGHGKGITVGVTTVEQLEKAVKIALSFNRSARIAIAQQQFDHPSIHDLRLVCINYKFIGSINRVPAQVEADGTQTVAQLIEAENTSGKRGEPYYAPLAKIDPVAAFDYLGDNKDRVYPAGQQVQVMAVANYGAGGEIHDVTDQIPSWMQTMAEEVSRVLELPVCGVDFMVDKLPTTEMNRSDLDATIIEVNKAPSLAIHDTPTSGKPRGAVAAYVEYLANL